MHPAGFRDKQETKCEVQIRLIEPVRSLVALLCPYLTYSGAPRPCRLIRDPPAIIERAGLRYKSTSSGNDRSLSDMLSPCLLGIIGRTDKKKTIRERERKRERQTRTISCRINIDC